MDMNDGLGAILKSFIIGLFLGVIGYRLIGNWGITIGLASELISLIIFTKLAENKYRREHKDEH